MEKQSTTSAPSLKQEAGPPSKPILNPFGNYGEGRKALIDKSLIPPQNETYPGRDSNPYALRHQIESLTRIPIPPPGLAASPPCSNKVGEVLFEDSTEPQSGQSFQTDSDVNGNFNSWWILLKEPWRLKFGLWELLKLWNLKPYSVYDIRDWKRLGECIATHGRLFGRVVLLGPGEPLKCDYAFRAGRFAILSKEGGRWDQSPSFVKWMCELNVLDFSSTISREAISTSDKKCLRLAATKPPPAPRKGEYCKKGFSEFETSSNPLSVL